MSKETVMVDGRPYPKFVILYVDELLSEEAKELPLNSLRIWIQLHNHCHRKEGERAWSLSWAKLQDTLKISRASVGRGLKDLKELGLIHSERTQGVNRITLLRPPSLKSETSAEVPQAHPCDSGRITQHDTPEGSASETTNSTHKTDSSTGKEKTKKKKGSKRKNTEDKSQGFLEWIDDFIELIHREIVSTRDYEMDPNLMVELEGYYLAQRSHFVHMIQHLTKGVYATSAYEKECIDSLEFRSRFFKTLDLQALKSSQG